MLNVRQQVTWRRSEFSPFKFLLNQLASEWNLWSTESQTKASRTLTHVSSNLPLPPTWTTRPDLGVFSLPQMVLTAFSRVGMLREAWPPSAWRKTPWGTSTTTCQTSTLCRWRAWGSGRCSSWVSITPQKKKSLTDIDWTQISWAQPGLCDRCVSCFTSAESEEAQHSKAAAFFLYYSFERKWGLHDIRENDVAIFLFPVI